MSSSSRLHMHSSSQPSDHQGLYRKETWGWRGRRGGQRAERESVCNYRWACEWKWRADPGGQKGARRQEMAWSVKGVGAAQAWRLWLLSNLNGSARSGNERSGGVEGKRVFAMYLASALSIITLAECPTRCIILLWASRSWPSAPLGTLICFLHWKLHWTQVNMGAENDSPKVQGEKWDGPLNALLLSDCVCIFSAWEKRLLKNPQATGNLFVSRLCHQGVQTKCPKQKLLWLWCGEWILTCLPCTKTLVMDGARLSTTLLKRLAARRTTDLRAKKKAGQIFTNRKDDECMVPLIWGNLEHLQWGPHMIEKKQ